jgi:hypothetical protein
MLFEQSDGVVSKAGVKVVELVLVGRISS